MILSNAAIRNRTTVGVLMVLIVVMGAYSYVTLPREAAPDVPIPRIVVSTAYEGVSPADIESSVTWKIEKELAGLKGLKEVTSSSAEGLSTIIAEFLPDVKVDDAMQYVRDKVELAKGDLPADADEPTLKEINVAEFPIMMINITGDISPVRLKFIADELEDAIEAIPGVLNCDVLGGLEREIRLELDPDRVAAYGLTVPEILALIPSENVNISAGGLETPGTQFHVRVRAEFERPDEVDHLLLTVRNGKGIYLADVAKVRDTFKDRGSYSRLDGAESITVSVQKRVGANLVQIAGAVRVMLAEAERRAPEGVRFEITLDQSKDIRMMVADLENNIFSGLVLVVAVLVLFLGWRTSAIVALVIPMSMLISFAVIQAVGFTLNMIVLFSLIMALGMLVDNAIVIVENIYRYREMGHGRVAAAMKGTAEVAWPVITSTATTVAAFLPLAFWPGIVGDFMKYLPITVIVVLTSSLFVALVINPMVCSLAAGGVARRKDEDRLLVRAYRRMLAWSLHHPAVTLAAAVGLLVGLIGLYRLQGHGREFFPDFDPRRAVVNIRSPQGTSIHESDRLARVVEERLRPFAGETRHVMANVGSTGSDVMSFGASAGGPHVANVTVEFYDYEERKRLSAEAVAEMREALADLAGAEVKVEKERHGPPTGAPVTVRVIGEDFGALEALSKRARAAIAEVGGLVNLRSDLEAARPELAFRVDRRRAMLLGVNTAVVGNFLKTAIFGRKVGVFRQFKDEYDITVRLPLSQRQEFENILRLHVPNNAGKAVPLSSLGDFEYTGGLGTINHVNQRRVITLTGDVEGRNADEVRKEVRQRLEKIDLPMGCGFQYAGEDEEERNAIQFLFFRALPVALLLIVMILVAQFNTVSVPLIIMTTVGLSSIGVLVGLLAHQLPFGVIMTGIGVISLAGVVVNNAIVLLDYTRQLQRRGLEVFAAALRAGVTRLRPVLLTAATTILGLVPMATGKSFDVHTFQFAMRSESSQWWARIAIAVIYGLAFATLLTLVVVPVLYVSLYGLAARLGLGGLRKAEEERAGVEVEDF